MRDFDQFQVPQHRTDEKATKRQLLAIFRTDESVFVEGKRLRGMVYCKTEENEGCVDE